MPATDRLTIRPLDQRVRILWKDTVLADTRACLALDETGYPERFYVPMADVSTDWLCVSNKQTQCPHKGDATYYHIHVDGDQLDDAAWCYLDPIADVEQIGAHLAFDHPALTIQQDPD